MGKLLDLQPRLRLKLQASCSHQFVSVDMSAADLTCDECGAEIDPWWYLRDLAKRNDAHLAWHQKVIDDVNQRVDAFNADIADMNDRIRKLNDEINRLNNRRLELANTTVNGIRVGSRRRRL